MVTLWGPWCGWSWGIHPAGSWGCQLGMAIGSWVRGLWLREHGDREGKSAALGVRSPVPRCEHGPSICTGSLRITEGSGRGLWPTSATRPVQLLLPHCTDEETEAHRLPSLPEASQSKEAVQLGQKLETKGMRAYL